MRILIYFSSHRQLKEIEYSSEFFNRTSFLKEYSDVMLHCDNDSYNDELIKSYAKYETNTFLVRSPQIRRIYEHHNGWSPIGCLGIIKGLNNNFHSFNNYDFVIHTVPDCYITNEEMIRKLILEESTTDNKFIVDQHSYINESCKTQFSGDFFIFKPKEIHNIFSEHDDDNPPVLENWIYDKIKEHQIKHRIICREGSPYWNIDSYGLIHNHNLLRIESILNGCENLDHRHY